ncbi:hypothetical protein ACIBHX_29485 [Nonomuraea sp. NPDC050536]|uniref:hypothetical protein n=1 Tax=Nonomuraea sp. NPDC050536 TaxID=3364366 RepID=UPI0037C93B6E
MGRGPRVMVLGLLLAGLAGCGSTTTSAHTDVQAEDKFRDILNKDPELPDGFSVRAQQAWRVPFAPGSRECRAVLDPAGGHAPARALTAQAAATYQGDGLGEVLAVGLARYAGSEAEGHIEDLGKALLACRGVRAEDGTHLRLRTLPVKGVGDEAVGGELRGRLNGYPYALDVMLVRTGDTLVSVVHTGIADVDAAKTWRLLGAVVGMAEP